MSTYEMIKALPGKGTDWRGLVIALRDHYIAVFTHMHGYAPPEWSIAEWNAAQGVRRLRQAAMEAAGAAVCAESQRSHFIPPSPKTLQWGGFLGGEHVSWTDHEAEAASEARIAAIIEVTR